LKDFISEKTGLPVCSFPFFDSKPLKHLILSEIDNGHPVLLSWGKHSVVLLGYTEKGEKIIMHDPKNQSPADDYDGTMYTVRS